MREALELHRLSAEWEQPLAAFFQDLERGTASKYFHPHPFSAERAHQLANYTGLDLYYVLVEGRRVLGYGLLRGWDANFDVPSLGIVLRDEIQGHGLGEAFIGFLHQAAARRGATRIRLKVYPENKRALRLYQKVGYKFDTELDADQLVGHHELRQLWRQPDDEV